MLSNTPAASETRSFVGFMTFNKEHQDSNAGYHTGFGLFKEKTVAGKKVLLLEKTYGFYSHPLPDGTDSTFLERKFRFRLSGYPAELKEEVLTRVDLGRGIQCSHLIPVSDHEKETILAEIRSYHERMDKTFSVSDKIAMANIKDFPAYVGPDKELNPPQYIKYKRNKARHDRNVMKEKFKFREKHYDRMSAQDKEAFWEFELAFNPFKPEDAKNCKGLAVRFLRAALEKARNGVQDDNDHRIKYLNGVLTESPLAAIPRFSDDLTDLTCTTILDKYDVELENNKEGIDKFMPVRSWDETSGKTHVLAIANDIIKPNGETERLFSDLINNELAHHQILSQRKTYQRVVQHILFIKRLLEYTQCPVANLEFLKATPNQPHQSSLRPHITITPFGYIENDGSTKDNTKAKELLNKIDNMLLELFHHHKNYLAYYEELLSKENLPLLEKLFEFAHKNKVNLEKGIHYQLIKQGNDQTILAHARHLHARHKDTPSDVNTAALIKLIDNTDASPLVALLQQAHDHAAGPTNELSKTISDATKHPITAIAGAAQFVAGVAKDLSAKAARGFGAFPPPAPTRNAFDEGLKDDAEDSFGLFDRDNRIG